MDMELVVFGDRSGGSLVRPSEAEWDLLLTIPEVDSVNAGQRHGRKTRPYVLSEDRRARRVLELMERRGADLLPSSHNSGYYVSPKCQGHASMV